MQRVRSLTIMELTVEINGMKHHVITFPITALCCLQGVAGEEEDVGRAHAGEDDW